MIPKSLLSILGVTASEDVNTRLLCHAINHERAFRDAFVTRILGWPQPSGDSKVVAKNQVPVRVKGRGRRLDLVLTMHDSSQVRVGVVENKLMAGEGDDQTTDYASAEVTSFLHESMVKDRLIDSSTHVEMTRRFLVVQPNETAESVDFITVRHSEVAAAIGDCADRLESPVVRELLLDWQRHVQAFEAALSNVDLTRPLSELFPEPASGLDVSYGIFCTVVASLVEEVAKRVSKDVRHWTYRGAGQGRSWFGVKLWEPHWDQKPRTDQIARSLHFQLTWNPLDRALQVTLHHETNPYMSENSADSEFPEALVQYRLARENAVKSVGEGLSLADWRKCGTWNVFARAVNLEGVTDRSTIEVVASVADRIAAAWPAVEAVARRD